MKSGFATTETIQLRLQLNVTQRELAEIMGVSTLSVSRYERGSTKPTGPFLKLLRIMVKYPYLIAEIRAN